MNNNYFDFYVGEDPEDDFKSFEYDSRSLRIVIFENTTRRAETAFEIDILQEFFTKNRNKLDQNSDFWRYAFFIKNQQPQGVRDHIKTLIFNCAEQGNIWETFNEYASFPFEEVWELPDLKPELISTYMPKMTWRFDTIKIEEGATMYDERIVVTSSWTWEDKQYSFKGYWYVTSVAFILQRLETIDPYYRRFILLSHAFCLEHLKKQLSEELEYLSTIHPTSREHCLKNHFEYDGKSMFYER